MQPVMQHLGPSPIITNLGFVRSGLSEMGSLNASRAIRHAAVITQYRRWTSQSKGWAKHPDSRSLRILRILWGPMHIIYVKIETQIAAGSCIGPTATIPPRVATLLRTYFLYPIRSREPRSMQPALGDAGCCKPLVSLQLCSKLRYIRNLVVWSLYYLPQRESTKVMDCWDRNRQRVHISKSSCFLLAVRDT
jgi:hypothetical protein